MEFKDITYNPLLGHRVGSSSYLIPKINIQDDPRYPQWKQEYDEYQERLRQEKEKEIQKLREEALGWRNKDFEALNKIACREFWDSPLKNLLFRFTLSEDYDAQRIELYSLKDTNKFVYVITGHCSCYGFEDIKPENMDMTIASESQLLKLCETWLNGDELEKQLVIYIQSSYFERRQFIEIEQKKE